MESTTHALVKQLRRLHPVGIFVAAETHLSGSYHFHGLLQWGPLRPRRTQVWETLFRTYGRSQVQEIADIGGVTGYVSKYITKSPAWWDIY